MVAAGAGGGATNETVLGGGGSGPRGEGGRGRLGRLRLGRREGGGAPRLKEYLGTLLELFPSWSLILCRYESSFN